MTMNRKSLAAWISFQAAVEALGGTVLEDAWKGTNRGHQVRCPRGHVSSVHPATLVKGGGICRMCNTRDWQAAWINFQAAVEALGGTVLEGAWKGSHAPHRVRCAAGHEVTPRPSSLSQGQGLCRMCRGRIWDVFYVVRNPDIREVKFGITSGNPKPRLQDHARYGFLEVVRLHTGLPGVVAPDAERAVKSGLKGAGIKPTWNFEYFPESALTVIDPIVDGFVL